ncbi:MAG: hypothetical protein ABSA32_09390 [Candidatus Acidiferrales bacterium]
MNPTRGIEEYENDAPVLEKIAGNYPEESVEYLVLKKAAFALLWSLTQHHTEFKEYLANEEGGDLTPEQRQHLIDMGIDPDVDPDAKEIG